MSYSPTSDTGNASHVQSRCLIKYCELLATPRTAVVLHEPFQGSLFDLLGEAGLELMMDLVAKTASLRRIDARDLFAIADAHGGGGGGGGGGVGGAGGGAGGAAAMGGVGGFGGAPEEAQGRQERALVPGFLVLYIYMVPNIRGGFSCR